MKTRELFIKDPLSWQLVNEGVSSNNSTDLDTLRYELETFVCQGEYEAGLARILHGYLTKFGGEQTGSWVSGFYGSGKSHLVKVLRYLWSDFKFPDGKAARNIARLPNDVTDHLKELSRTGKQGSGLHQAGGTLKAGVGSVRLRVLAIVFQSVGLPEKLQQARLLLDLADEGKRERFEKAVEKAGKALTDELPRMYTSKVFQEAYLTCHPHLGDVKAVSQALTTQYPTKVEDISIEDMLREIRRALRQNGEVPCTVLVLDEVQQFINNDSNIALEVQEVVEACSKGLDGRVLVVGTGQSALTDTPALQRLMGRFAIKVHLRDNDVEKVIRTVVLQKKEARKKDIDAVVEQHSGEIARQLSGTKIATRPEDDRAYVPDYPLLPVRRRFWEHVLHATDPSGTTAQMRTQLRVTHEACRSVGNKELGAVVPADFLYEQLANDLVISGEMQKRFQEIIEEQRGKPDGSLRSRVCALVFLINKLPRQGADIGVRATAEHLGDLLTDDLGPAAAKLRQKVPALVQDLVSTGVLMEIEGELQLQTTEGAAWEAEYRRRRSAILGSDPQLAAHRSQLLSKAIQDALTGTSVLHGSAREKRKVVVHQSMEPPASSDGLTVWVRDGFQESENAIVQDIQRRSVEDATIHVVVPKSKADEMKNAIAASVAAEETINFRGNPSGQEGKDARAAIVSRQAHEEAKLQELLGDVLGRARVFLSGGQELPPVITLEAAVEDAAAQVLDRLYPKFGQADSANWPTVWKRAKEGNAAALSAVGYNGDPEKHPVAAALLAFIGAGKRGSEVVAQFTGTPYGWPKDAVDATLATLVVSGHLGARLHGQPAKLADLDQRRLSQADFRVEHPVLAPFQKLRIKKLFQYAGHPFQPGDEAAAAPGFVALLRQLAQAAGGEPPAPEPPHAPDLLALEGIRGNDLMAALFEKADDLTHRIDAWQASASEIRRLLVQFTMTKRLLGHAAGVAGTAALNETVECILSNRSLLEDPDPVLPVLISVSSALRTALLEAHAAYEWVFAAEKAKLESHPVWTKLSQDKKTALMASVEGARLVAPHAATDPDLLTALDACSLSAWRTASEALPTKFAHVLAAAIKEAEPKARRLALPAATLRTSAEVESWLAEVREKIQEALGDGPVIV